MEEMLWIEDIVENTQAPPFFTNYKINKLIFSLEEKYIFVTNQFVITCNFLLFATNVD
jgi:hypothetical protein